MKYWVKTIKGEKILKNVIVELEMKLSRQNFPAFVREVCLEIDEPTPIVTDSQYGNFSEFNVVRFKSADYVESVPFERFTIEIVPEK